MARLTWWGHATATVEDSGVRILTDPVLTARLGHLARRSGALPGAAALHADLVVVSHLHADHLHRASLRLLAPGTRVVVPQRAASLLAGLPLEVVEVVPGDVVAVGAVRVHVVPAVHDGRRHPLSRVTAPALGFVVHGERRTYFPGDTELFDDMAAVAGPVDALLAPVGGWGPTLGAGHMGPAQAAELVVRTAPAVAVPVHYGTLWPSGLAMVGVREHLFHGPGILFAAEVAQRRPDTRVVVLDHGASVQV